MARTGTSVYPATIDAFDRIGTANYQDESGYDIVNVENEAMDAIEHLEAVVGTTAGTSVLKNVLVGQFVATTAGTETLTNKTLNGATLGTPAIGNFTSATHAHTSTATGGAVTTSKILNATRASTGTSGDVAYTSVGFQPTALKIDAILPGTLVARSMGFGDASGDESCIYYGYNTLPILDTNYIVECDFDGSNKQLASLKSLDADGFTLTWTRQGTADWGTVSLNILAWR